MTKAQLILASINDIEEQGETAVAVFIDAKAFAEVIAETKEHLIKLENTSNQYALFGVTVHVDNKIATPFCVGNYGHTVNLYDPDWNFKPRSLKKATSLNKFKFMRTL